MKLFSFVFLGIILQSVHCNNYNGGSDTQQGRPSLSSQSPQTSGLPQYESGASGKDELWWLKGNPFQKPANHPGLERGEGQMRPSQQQPNKPTFNQNIGTFSNRPSVRPASPTPGGWESQNKEVSPVEENPDCLLRNKADCHLGLPVTNTVGPVPVQQNLNIAVPETAYRPPTYNDAYEKPKPIPQPHGPTPPPLPYLSNRQASHSTGQYDPKPYTNFNVQYQSANQSPQPKPYNQPSSFQTAKPVSYTQNSGQGVPVNNNFEQQPPYPGCPAAMLCIAENYCNVEGVSVEQPITLSPAEKLFRVALMPCSFPTTGEVGVCCRDRNYKDPWPDMGSGHEHHLPKDSSGGHNNGQYKPQNHNSGQYHSGNNNEQYNPGVISYQHPFVTKDIPDSPGPKGTESNLVKRAPKFHRCDATEECIPSYRCPLIANATLNEDEKCDPDFGSFEYYCCKRVRRPFVGLSTFIPFTEAPEFKQSEEPTTQSYSTEIQKTTGQPGEDLLITGSGLPLHHQTTPSIEGKNPYGENEEPIQLIEHFSEPAIVVTTSKHEPNEQTTTQATSSSSILDEREDHQFEQKITEEITSPSLFTSPTFETTPVTNTEVESESEATNVGSTTPQSHDTSSTSTKRVVGIIPTRAPENVPIRQYKYFHSNAAKSLSQFFELPKLTPDGVSISLENATQEDSLSETTPPTQFPITDFYVTGCGKGTRCVPQWMCRETKSLNGNFKRQVQNCRLQNSGANSVCCTLDENGSEDTSEDKSCGLVKHQNRFFNNDTVNSPWQALLRYEGRQCQGAIISRRVIATTASCVQNITSDNLEIRVENDKQNFNPLELSYQEIQAGVIISHPKYRTGNLSYNVALVFTTKNINFGRRVGRLCLPHPSENLDGILCTSSTTKLEFAGLNNYGPSRLNETDGNSTGKCEQRLQRLCRGFHLEKTILCGDAPSGCENCSPEEGMPLVCENEKSGNHLLAGLTTKISEDYGCSDSNLPVTFTNVVPLLQWMFNFVSRNPDDVVAEQLTLRARAG